MARVIAKGAPTPGTSMVPPDWRGKGIGADAVAEARVRAARLLLDARAQAREIISSAHAMAQEVVLAEQKQGYEQGYIAGLDQARQEGVALMARLSPLVSSAAVSVEQTMRNGDAALVSLATAIAGAIAKRAIDMDPETVARVLEEAIGDVSASATVTIRVHPDDEAAVVAHMPLAGLPSTTRVTVMPDSGMTRGGCLIEGGAGYVDATLETRLAQAEALLRDHL